MVLYDKEFIIHNTNFWYDLSRGYDVRSYCSYLLAIRICDWACENQPCKRKKIANFSSLQYHNLRNNCTNIIKPLSLLQNLMGFLLKFTEMEYHIQR